MWSKFIIFSIVFILNFETSNWGSGKLEFELKTKQNQRKTLFLFLVASGTGKMIAKIFRSKNMVFSYFYFFFGTSKWGSEMHRPKSSKKVFQKSQNVGLASIFRYQNRMQKKVPWQKFWVRKMEIVETFGKIRRQKLAVTWLGWLGWLAGWLAGWLDEIFSFNC